MGTNAGWPEAFGFRVCGGAPVVISEVEEGGSAQHAGLQPGDVITELDGEEVQQWSLDQVLSRARTAVKVPPSLVVISRVRQFRLRRDPEGGYGLTIRGNGPVFVRSVDFPSPARQAGLRSGDLLLEVNGQNVQCSSKLEVLELLRGSSDVLTVMVVAGGLDWDHSTPLPSPSTSHLTTPLPPSSTSHLTHLRKMRNNTKYQKAAIFHSKVNYYLMGDTQKKAHLLTLLRLYARARDVDSLAGSLDVLLDGPIERRIIPAIRDFLHPRHCGRFDTLLSISPVSVPATPTRRSSVDTLRMPRNLAATRGAPWASSLPSLTAHGDRERLVQVNRGSGGFGFSLSGNAPVFIRSVDPGGPAALAGLLPHDHLLAINGINTRHATHSHVIRLLRGSGTTPSLLVSSIGSDRTNSLRHGRMGGASHGVDVASSFTGSEEGQLFRQKMTEVLLPKEREQMVKELATFSRQRDIPQLVEGLCTLLNDPAKMALFHYVCQLLPEESQAEFDRMAAARLGDRGQSSLTRTESETFLGECILEDTAIGSVGEYGGVQGGQEDRGILGPLREEEEGEEGEWVRKKAQPEQRGEGSGEWLRDGRGVGSTPGQTASVAGNRERGTSKPLRRRSTEATPTAPTVADITSISTPGIVPPPPPTPAVGPGGIPLPPPPPPSTLSSQPHMKRVNWQKMAKTDGTVWGEMSGLDEAVELSELDTQFALRRATEPAGSIKPRKPSVLDSKKAYNISILLAHLKLPTPTIKQAVLSCDNSLLREEHLRQMAAFAPDKRECLGFARYYDNPSILSLPDQFSCEMSTIPCYRERLHSMVFRLHFLEKVNEIKPDLEAICQASVQLQKSKHFKKILELVLAIGNHMNMGNMRIGQAQGFSVAFLSQLRGLRTTDGTSTLLHFLAGLTERKFPHVLAFPKDLSACSQASRVSGQTLEVEMHELSQGLQDIRNNIQEISSRDELPGDRFRDVMTSFLAESEVKLSKLLDLYTQMKQEFKQLVHFFGEDPAKMRIDDFFSIFASFITDFESAVRENRKAQHEAMENQQQKEGGTARRRGQGNKPRPPDKGQYQQFKEELEKTRLRPIPQTPHAGTEQRPQHTNFTHLLKPAWNRDRDKSATPTNPGVLPQDDETFF